MPDYSGAPHPKVAERALGLSVDWLRRLGARATSNYFLRLVRLLRRDKAVEPVAAPRKREPPSGPYVEAPGLRDTPALLIFVPRSWHSRVIDGLTGGYGYSHVAVDCGEIDEPTGQRVMIESVPGRPVQRSFLDVYGSRNFVRVPLAGRGIDTAAFCAGVRSKVGETYDNLEALTWGEVDDPAKQICSDLATVCLPPAMLQDLADRAAAGGLPRRSVSAHHRGTPGFHIFVSPNAFAAYFGAPPGERLRRPDQSFLPSRRRRRRRAIRAKLIYNPLSGSAASPDARLAEIIAEMQRQRFLPEVHVVTHTSNLHLVATDAIRRGMRFVVVAGGDGTVNETTGALAGSGATLGIIPIGTRNNVAYSLGIPEGNIAAAVELLRTGQKRRVDVAFARCNGNSRWYLEVATVGLVTSLYGPADDLQHGDLARAADIVTTFLAAEPSSVCLTVNHEPPVTLDAGHAVLIANMPYFGGRFRPTADARPDDGLLDVLVMAGLSKLDLIAYAAETTAGRLDSPRVAHYQARRVVIEAEPAMPVMADGVMLGMSPVEVRIRPRGLTVMGGR